MIVAGVQLQPFPTPEPYAVDRLRGTCPVDGHAWQVVAATSMVHPLRDTGRSYAGERLYSLDPTRPSAQVEFTGDDGAVLTVSWSWRCGGHTLVATVPTHDTVPCRYHAGDREGCRQWEYRQGDQPSDFYNNPRYGQSCYCCGHAGTHTVRRDGEGPAPLCGASTSGTTPTQHERTRT